MGRIGISEYQVFQAADLLAADGVHPSVDTVRVELGNTGSRTTINKYLKEWREQRTALKDNSDEIKQLNQALRSAQQLREKDIDRLTLSVNQLVRSQPTGAPKRKASVDKAKKK